MPDNKNNKNTIDLNKGATAGVPYKSESIPYGYIGAKTADLTGTGFGKESYDTDDIRSPYILDPEKLEQVRGERQGWGAELGNAIAGGIAKIPFSVIGNVASILDLEDYYNKDNEVGNIVTAWAEEVKGNIEEATKIYKSNDNTLGSREWWMNNGKGLIDSAAGFVITGGAVGKGVQLLSNLAKGSKVIQGIGTVANAAMLNQAEGIPIAMDIYKNTYNLSLNKQKVKIESGEITEQEADELAKQEAADAAAYSININRINIPLNLTSASAFLRPIPLTRQVAKDFSKKEIVNNLIKEGSQEYLEENINMIAEKEALRKAVDGNKYNYDFDNTVSDILSKEGFETGLVGFVGGIAQTGGTELLKSFQKDSPSYDSDGNVKLDVNGQPILVTPQQSQKERFRAQQKSLKTIETLASLEGVSSVKETLDNIKRTSQLVNDIQIASLENDEELVNSLKNDLLTNQAINAFKNGTTENLISLYENITKDPEAINKYGTEVFKTSKEAISHIENLENIYNQNSKLPQVNEVVDNRSKYIYNIEAHDNIKSNINKLIIEQNKEINALGDVTPEQIELLSSTKELKLNNEKLDLIKDNLNKLNSQYQVITNPIYTEMYIKEKNKQKEVDTPKDEIKQDIKTPTTTNSDDDQSIIGDSALDEFTEGLGTYDPGVEQSDIPELQEDEYNNFVDNNIVSDQRLNWIADKVINHESLNEYENAIFNSRTSDINSIIETKNSQKTNPKEIIDNTNLDIVGDAVSNTEPISSDVDTLLDNSELNNGKAFSTTKPNAIMMKLFKMTGKKWSRNNEGEVEVENTSVSSEVNNPEVANIGSEVEYRITTLNDIEAKRNEDNINNSKLEINKALNRGTTAYTQEDLTGEGRTESIGIYQNDTLIGFVALPHFIYMDPTKPEEYEVQLATRQRLIEERKEILKRLKNGPVKTTVIAKGNGKLLTRTKFNKEGIGHAVLNNIITRDQDLFDGKHLFVYDNGITMTTEGDLQQLFDTKYDEVSKIVSNIKSLADADGKGKGRVYKVVQTANGKYYIIPIYTNTINKSTAKKITKIIKEFNDYKETTSKLQDYVFTTSIRNTKYAGNLNALRIDDINRTIHIGNKIFSIDDIANNINIAEFEKTLSTLRHNINALNINNKLYQDELINNGILQSNAYVSNGQFYVQPYIETESLLESKSKDDTIIEIKPATKIETPVEDNDISNYNGSEDDVDDNDAPFSKTKYNDQLKRSHKILNRILPGLSFADVEQLAKVKPHIKDAYGMYKNMLIYLFEGATDKTAYHEAFHGVFRNMLSDDERLSLIDEAKSKYNTPTDEELNDLRNTSNNKLSNDDLVQLYYEEKLADSFAEFVDSKVNISLGKRILNFFKSIFDMFNIFKGVNDSQINDLFDNIYSGKFAEKSKLANRYIDSSKFNTTAYARIAPKNIKLGTEMERIKSIADQYLAKFNAQLMSGKDVSKINPNDIFKDIKLTYQKVFNEEIAKPENKRNKTILDISAAIYNNFDASNNSSNNFVDAVKKEIESRQIKLTGNLYDLDTDTPLGENETNEPDNTNLNQGNTTKAYGQEMTSINSVRSATHALKLFLSSVPVLKDGVVETDAFGFTKYHNYSSLYYTIEKMLAHNGATTITEQERYLKDASRFKPEFKQILDMLNNIADPSTKQSMRRQFATNFSKQVLNYKLILFQKKNNKYTFKIIEPNRKNARRELTDKWKRINLQDPANKVMDKYRYWNPTESRFEYNIEELNKLVNLELDSKTKEYTVEEFHDIARSVGVDFDIDSLTTIWESSKASIRDNLKNFIKGITNNNIGAQNKAIRDLVSKHVVGTTEMFTSSFNNAENSRIYALQNQSFASRLVKKLHNESSAIELMKELTKDPMYKYNDILKLSVSMRDSIYDIFYLDGLKPVGENQSGKKFNQIHVDDYEAMCINLFLADPNIDSPVKAPAAIYSPIIPAEKGLTAIYKGPKYSVKINKEGYLVNNNNNPIISKFMDRFRSEASRIQQALLDKKNGVKAIENYHFDSNSSPDSWNGNAYKFWTIDFQAIDSNGKVKKHLDNESVTKQVNEYLNTNLDNPNAVDDMSVIDPALYKSIQAKVVAALNAEILSQTNSLISKDIVTKTDTGLTSNFINVEKSDDLKQVIADYTLNTWLFNIDNSLLNNGDPAIYKGDKDFGKRFYQSMSMTKHIDTDQIDDSFEILKDKKIRINIINDFETSSKSTDNIKQLVKGRADESSINAILDKSYSEDKINVTDAQLFVSQKLYSEIKKSIGNIDTGLESIKPFIYGTQWNEELKKIVPVQIKCSIMPLTDEYVKNNPLLKKHKDRMDADPKGPQVIGFKSAFKALSPQGVNIESNEISQLDVNLDLFGFQVDNTDHSDTENTSMRQLKMLFYGMMDNDTIYAKIDGQEMTGKVLKDMLFELESANLIASNKELTNMFNNDKKALHELIKEAVTKRNATSIIEKIFEVNPDGSFKYNLDLTGHTQVIQMISSLYTKRTILQKFKGGSHVQASSLGYRSDESVSNLKDQQSTLTPEELSLQTSLEWIKADPKDPNSISYIDIAIPVPDSLSEFVNDDGTLKQDLPEDLRRMLVYRIPTEDAHSTMVCRVKHFLPKNYKNTILMPYEVTMQFGADFDFDKTFFIMKWFNPKTGYVPKYSSAMSRDAIKKRYNEYVKSVIKDNKEASDLVKSTRYEGSTIDDDIYNLLNKDLIQTLDQFSELPIALQNTKEARDNQIVDIYMKSLRHVNMLESLITPSGPGDIEKVYKKVSSKATSKANYFTARAQTLLKDIFHSISKLKGAAALHVTGHAYGASGNLEIVDGKSVKVFKNGKLNSYKNLSKVLSENGKKIVGEVGGMLATVLDAAKKPDQLYSIGINDITLDSWATLVRLGLGTEFASSFTSQVSLKEFSRAASGNFKQLKGDNHTNVTVDQVLNKYKKLYSDLYQELTEDTTYSKMFKDASYNQPESVGKSSIIDEEVLYNNTKSENDIAIFLSDPNVNVIEKLKYYKLQIAVLNTFVDLQPINKELKDLNSLFNINTEAGPNFEDINSNRILYSNIMNEQESLVLGKKDLISNPLLNSYMDIQDSTYNTINSHFMFASNYFNSIKEGIASLQKNDPNILTLKSEDRDIINNITRMFIDASTAFKDVYNNPNITDEDVVDEVNRILYTTKETTKPFKLFNNEVLSKKQIEDIRNTHFFKNIEIATVHKSGKRYIKLKANSLEKSEKENIITSLVSLFSKDRYRELAKGLVNHSFKTTGFLTGLDSYASLIDPDIAVAMGLQDTRNETKLNLAKGIRPLPFLAEERVKDQIIRNYPSKFTKVYDNNNKNAHKMFTIDGNDLILDSKSPNPRIKELIKIDSDGIITDVIDYIRFRDDKGVTKLYKLDTEADTIKYISISKLGYEGIYVEINPFDDLVKSELPENNYEKYEPLVKSKDGSFTKMNALEEFTGESVPESSNTNMDALEDEYGSLEGKEISSGQEAMSDFLGENVDTSQGDNIQLNENTPLNDNNSFEIPLENITFKDYFTIIEQDTILNNFSIKHSTSKEAALNIINNEIAEADNKQEYFDKLKNCYSK